MDHICQPHLPDYLILSRQSPLKLFDLCQNCLITLSLDDIFLLWRYMLSLRRKIYPQILH